MTTTCYAIRRLGILSLGKFFAALGFAGGFLVAILFLITAILATPGIGFGIIMRPVFIIIIATFGGFVCGIIWAFVYNTLLGASGGIEMDLEVKV
jgi:hypothetical protein